MENQSEDSDIRPVVFLAPVLQFDGRILDTPFPSQEEARTAHRQFEKDVVAYQKRHGLVRRWKEDDILLADSGLIKMAYVVDDSKEGTEGWHGPRQVWVEYISTETGKLWDD